MDTSIIDESLLVAILVSGFLLGSVTLIGLLAAVLQAATQIQDQTLSAVPKLLTLCVTLFICGRWIFEQLQTLLVHSLREIASLRM